MMFVFASSATPAEGQEGNPPRVECASESWNGDYWKVQVNNGSLGGIEANPDDDGLISLDSDGSWTNNHTADVFRIVLKVGEGVGGDVTHEPPVDPIDLETEGLSHVTFCFTAASTTTSSSTTSTSTTSTSTTSTSTTSTSTTSTSTTTTSSTTTTTQPTTTTSSTTTTTTPPPPPPPPEDGEIVVQKLVQEEGDPQGFAFTFETTGFTLGDNTLAHGESSSSGNLDAGNYAVSEVVPSGWTQVSATCDDGSAPSDIDLAAGETVTCTFVNTIPTDVQASIVVTVAGICEVDGDEGEGVIDVEISVDGGADVVISDSDGDVIETLSSSATVTVPEGATYGWEATPNEGFEFPTGSETSGSITIETCSDDPETLPFTGLDTGMMSVLASALLGGGLLLVNAMRRQEEA